MIKQKEFKEEKLEKEIKWQRKRKRKIIELSGKGLHSIRMDSIFLNPYAVGIT